MNKFKKDILIGFFIFVLSIILLYYLWENNVMLTIFFLVISAFVLLKWANREEKFIYLTSFILVPIIDLILVPKGVWNYGNATMFNIPVWLPFSYGILTVVAIKIAKAISKLF